MKNNFLAVLFAVVLFTGCGGGVDKSLRGTFWFAEVDSELTDTVWKINITFISQQMVKVLATNGTDGFNANIELIESENKWYLGAVSPERLIAIGSDKITINPTAFKEHWSVTGDKITFSKVRELE